MVPAMQHSMENGFVLNLSRPAAILPKRYSCGKVTDGGDLDGFKRRASFRYPIINRFTRLRLANFSKWLEWAGKPDAQSAVAKVAIARKLAVRLYWTLREAAQPLPSARMQGSPVGPVVGESLSPN